jgi:phosphopantothenoylcysteine decarboxylase/phosphopantothenate--cysteine ligase
LDFKGFCVGHVILGVSGGIAAYKSNELIRLLQERGHEVRVVATPNALHFVSPVSLQALSGHPIRSELFSLGEESEISHIELAEWAEVVLVAPATAGVLARLAHGLASDLLATVCLATRAPLVLAPSMNTNMYEHPATQANLDILAKRGARIVGPGVGDLACGAQGPGRLVALDQLTGAVAQVLDRGTFRNEVVMVTAGPTAEPIDPVRVLTNRSSGRMGFALAEEAAGRGAEVVLVAGPVDLSTPYGVERIDVESAQEMQQAVMKVLDRATIVIMAAAVADYRVAEQAEQKLKRERRERMTLELVQNPDILSEVVQRQSGCTVVGFAAETQNLLENARAKLARKGCDLIVANDVSRADTGFDVDLNAVWILGPGAEEVVEVPAASKAEVAARILDRVRQVRGP